MYHHPTKLWPPHSPNKYFRKLDADVTATQNISTFEGSPPSHFTSNPLHMSSPTKPDQLTVSPKHVPQIHPPSPRSPRLPKENPEAIRGLALKAGWNLQMLQNSARAPRKCPVLPSFVPRAVGQGLTVSGYQQSEQPQQNPLFHGGDVSQPPKSQCPFRDHATANSSEND